MKSPSKIAPILIVASLAGNAAADKTFNIGSLVLPPGSAYQTDCGSVAIYGLGLVGVSVNGTELVEGVTATVSAEETPEVEVQVQNQGESTENGISVSVAVDGSNTLQGTIETIAAGEIASVSIPLTPTPKGQVTLEVEVETVPGEQVSENNEASYTVAFE